jgi:hypothetical protein
MTPTLLLPAALAALAALVVPLVIHLARKSEQRPTDFAALRWLRQRPKPRHRIRFDEWPLLVARLLLLALVALYLAEPALRGAAGGRRWIAVVPGASPPVTEDADVRWLAPGFPPATAPMPVGPLPVASLLRQLDADLPPQTALTVLVPAILDGADAARPRLSRTVDWHIVGDAMAAAPSRKTTPPPMLAVHAGGAAGLRYVRAAAAAWTAPGTPPAIAGASPLPPPIATLVWFAPGPLPPPVLRWIERGGTALVSAATPLPAATPVWRDMTGVPLAEQAGRGRGRVIRFTRPLTPASMPDLLEPDFPGRLRALLDPPAPPPTRVRAADYRPLTGVEPYVQPAQDLRPWLAVAIAVLLLGERWLATRRRREIAP